MGGSIVNARKLHCIAVDPRHGITLVFMSCQHDTKYVVPCHASDRPKIPCHGPSSNDIAQVSTLGKIVSIKLFKAQILCVL